MKEYFLIIRNLSEQKEQMPADIHEEFIKKCETYIGKLKQDGKLIAAQPLVREGVIISGTNDAWKEIEYNENPEVQVGYYHILADDIDDAISIAKGNPDPIAIGFEYSDTARIEVRPIKMKENTTGFVYPKST